MTEKKLSECLHHFINVDVIDGFYDENGLRREIARLEAAEAEKQQALADAQRRIAELERELAEAVVYVERWKHEQVWI